MGVKNEKARKRSWQRRWGVISTVIVAIVLLFAIILVAFRVLGYQLYTVMSGSMEPEYHVGSLIFVKSVDTGELKPGDVITFMADEDTVVTHRIDDILVETTEQEAVRKFRTKGDANNVADAKLVHYKNVLGSPAFSIPLLGYLAFYIQRPPGLYIALIVGTLLIASVFLPGNKGKEKTASKKE